MNLTISDLPLISNGYKGTGGIIKAEYKHFIVDEIPAYLPSGEGEHLFVNLTKTGITTKEVQKALAGLYDIPSRDVEFAGIKDKNAVTSQYFSVWLSENQDKERVYELENQLPVKINSMAFHNRKIKSGHLKGNAFRIKITGIEIPLEEAEDRAKKIVEVIHQKGIPNYYGEQRFGMHGDNAEKGLKILKGKEIIKNKWLKRFLLSSYQSYLFNYYLKKRIDNRLFDKILTGDVAKKQDTGGIFIVDDKEEEQKRLDNKEICFTGPIFGKKMKQAIDEAGTFENSILTENEVTLEEFKNAKLTGTRRAGIILPKIEVTREEDGLILGFELPKGAFATVVLREIMKSEVNTD